MARTTATVVFLLVLAVELGWLGCLAWMAFG
jgi:hypothetical protein